MPLRSTPVQTIHTAKRTVTRTIGYTYLLAVPKIDAARPAHRWPVILFLHGSRERGNDVWDAAKHGPPKLLRGRDLTAAERATAVLIAQNFIVVSPQCPENQWWDPEAVLAVLDEVLATQPADPRRVYLTGLSMGGYGAWALGLAHPDRFAALGPVCGGGEFSTAFMSATHKRHDLHALGVWAFHGAKDPTVPPSESDRMIEMLKHMGVVKARLTLYPDATHDAWTETYANPELYTWFLQHPRPPARRKARVTGK